MLQQIFCNLIAKYDADTDTANALWHTIAKNYNSSGRYYHNLSHLENLLASLTQHSEMIEDWDTVVFAVFYHDAVYNTIKQDNEEKSAQLAEKELTRIGYPAHRIQRCKQHILATKRHESGTDTDTNLFTDADLSVLGADWDTYAVYYRNIRKEYAIYPDMLYNPGRKKVLQHFLAMDTIYKTAVYRDRYEQKAKENLQRELELI